MAKRKVETDGCPKPKGRLSIFPVLEYRSGPKVLIYGDAEGLRYLAAVLEHLADLDVEELSIPDGALAHIHLHPVGQIREGSAEVIISRGEKKGTKELAECLDD